MMMVVMIYIYIYTCGDHRPHLHMRDLCWKVVSESPRTVSWIDFRPGAGKWSQGVPEQLPGAIFGREPESSSREPQSGLLERFLAGRRKAASESSRTTSWSDFRTGAGKSPQRAPEQRPGQFSVYNYIFIFVNIYV